MPPTSRQVNGYARFAWVGGGLGGCAGAVFFFVGDNAAMVAIGGASFE
jgi:hypothetical protein